MEVLREKYPGDEENPHRSSDVHLVGGVCLAQSPPFPFNPFLSMCFKTLVGILVTVKPRNLRGLDETKEFTQSLKSLPLKTSSIPLREERRETRREERRGTIWMDPTGKD